MVKWDNFSDQPAHMRDKRFKRDIRKRHPADLLISAFTALCLYPVVLIRALLPFKPRETTCATLFGMAVSPDKEPEHTPALLDELGCDEILVRIHMDARLEFDRYEAFVRSLKKRRLLFVLIPSRTLIEEPLQLEAVCREIFTRFSPYADRFQVGNAINRIKWGFVLPGEYLRFFKQVQKVRDEEFKPIRLLGPSVIDFEYHVTIRALFNFFAIRYDGLSALLYVDRRGAPENRQMGFGLRGKIILLRALCALSVKFTSRDIYITETNYPLQETGKYAPTSKHERVDEAAYTAYMVRYYLLAASTRQVKTVYWHQLIAPGYGLIDNREGIRKREAFTAFAFMRTLLQPAGFQTLSQKSGIYRAVFTTPNSRITALWCNGETRQLVIPSDATLYSITGEALPNPGVLNVTDHVHYIIEETHG